MREFRLDFRHDKWTRKRNHFKVKKLERLERFSNIMRHDVDRRIR